MSQLDGHPTTKLTADDIDDLIYSCRTNDLDSLKQVFPNLATNYNTSEANIIQHAIDEDAEGMGSRACLLHYPAANGNLELIQYLLEKLGGTQSTSTNLVNHQNVSGNTPLHWAALNGHLEVVKALVKAGADPTVVNEAGRDAVVEAEYSSKESAVECANWLLKECEALEQGAGGVHADEQGGVQDEDDGQDDVQAGSGSGGKDDEKT